MKDAAQHLTAYSPGDAFKEVDTLPPLVEEAASPNTELWLVQLPVNELGPKDLMDKQWTMQPPDSDGKIGHFYSTRGDVYNVVNDNVDRKKLYAMMPGSSQHSVRRITSKVCFRRFLEVQPATSLGRTKSGVTTSEAKSRGDSTKSASVQKRAFTDDKQTSTVTEGSVGNSEVEKESKKKKKKKERKPKSEASS
ncbi:hypothetical protein KC19_8G103800 [Ceratodon purpureus]|uniref:Uncharacterized protein n=1 Tax=Ceratodon purpureus TaxID=3225 RepID=A0A8T0H1X8_CERPU|nr:hypothetical protein KC19_8G103800 [Ceratodon purpureus]